MKDLLIIGHGSTINLVFIMCKAGCEWMQGQINRTWQQNQSGLYNMKAGCEWMQGEITRYKWDKFS